MKIALLGALIALGGCATANTPSEVMTKTTAKLFISHLPPNDAADCIGRNADESDQLLAASTRPAPGGGREVIVRTMAQGASGLTYAVARLTPERSGSIGELWSDTFASSWTRSPQQKADMLLRGCTN